MWKALGNAIPPENVFLTVEISEKETYPLPLTSILSHSARLSSYFNRKVSEEKGEFTFFQQCLNFVILVCRSFIKTCSLVLWHGSFAVTCAQQIEPIVTFYFLLLGQKISQLLLGQISEQQQQQIGIPQEDPPAGQC